MEEIQLSAVIDEAESENIDHELVGLLDLRGVEVDVSDLARTVGRIARIAMIPRVAQDREVAVLDVGKAEAVAAARPVDRVRRLGRTTALHDLAVQRIDGAAIGRVERDPAKRRGPLRAMDRQDVVIRRRAAKVRRVPGPLDLRQIPDPGVEVRRAGGVVHLDLDAADAAHRRSCPVRPHSARPLLEPARDRRADFRSGYSPDRMTTSRSATLSFSSALAKWAGESGTGARA